MQCPQCGGDVWDNRSRKRAGKMKASGPDLACKDKEGCGWVQWPPKDGSASPGQPRAKATASSEPTLTWKELGDTYAKCVGLANWAWGSQILTPDAKVAAAATVFIQAMKSGLTMKPPAPKPPPPPPKPAYVPPEEPDDFDIPEPPENDLPY